LQFGSHCIFGHNQQNKMIHSALVRLAFTCPF